MAFGVCRLQQTSTHQEQEQPKQRASNRLTLPALGIINLPHNQRTGFVGIAAMVLPPLCRLQQ